VYKYLQHTNDLILNYSRSLWLLPRLKKLALSEPKTKILPCPQSHVPNLVQNYLKKTREILEYFKRHDNEEEDEEDPQEPEFKFSKKGALDTVAFLQKIAHHRPDLDVALPPAGHVNKFRSALAQEVEEAKVQISITSFLK
jgi:hypothetical protein